MYPVTSHDPFRTSLTIAFCATSISFDHLIFVPSHHRVFLCLRIIITGKKRNDKIQSTWLNSWPRKAWGLLYQISCVFQRLLEYIPSSLKKWGTDVQKPKTQKITFLWETSYNPTQKDIVCHGPYQSHYLLWYGPPFQIKLSPNYYLEDPPFSAPALFFVRKINKAPRVLLCTVRWGGTLFGSVFIVRLFVVPEKNDPKNNLSNKVTPWDGRGILPAFYSQYFIITACFRETCVTAMNTDNGTEHTTAKNRKQPTKNNK